MPKIPKVERSLSGFLSSECGRISKESIVRIGTTLGAAAIFTALFSEVVVAGHNNHWSNWSNWSNNPPWSNFVPTLDSITYS